MRGRSLLVPRFFFPVMCPYPIYSKRSRCFVPCGKCGACLKRQISDYTLRCQVEWRIAEKCYFVTLTYEKDPLQLYKKDLQSFFKRMRKVGFKFSYFALGDYGDTFGRPHYHVLFFSKGFFNPVYLHSLWISGDQTRTRGFIDVKPVTMGRIAYVVRYGFLAKLDFKKDGRQKPFFLMSRRPALGASYITANSKRWHLHNDFWYFPDGKWKKPLPRFFKDKIFSRFTRDLHNVRYLDEAQDKKDRELKALSASNTNPLKVWHEARLDVANSYLNDLRLKKLSKNKLLKM